MVLRSSFGSGLARRARDIPGRVWAIGDRGPNLKVRTAIERYGLDHLAPLAEIEGAKIMPRPDTGPTIAELRVGHGRVELIRSRRIAHDHGPVSGLPIPACDHLHSEPVFDLDGRALAPDSGGLDTEGIAAFSDGSFWVGDEFGPSLVRIDREGKVLLRLVPETLQLEAPYRVQPSLPAIAARRQLNRGFEALALSHDEKWLFLAFQSPLAHPDEAAHKQARHVRIWRLDAASGALAAQYAYPLDPPESFARDRALGPFGGDDVKVSEIAWLGGDSLLVLERGSETTKLYRIEASPELLLPPEHLEIATRPSVEELSGRDGGFPLPCLAKELLFTSDDARELPADMEGMALLSGNEILLVNDSDFGVEGAETSFWILAFDRPLRRG
jgi:hypothetical protein